MVTMSTKIVPSNPADPATMPNVDVTGRQRPRRQRQRPAERPDMLDVMEIRQRARAQFPTNDTIRAVRSAAALAAQDKAARMRGGQTCAGAARKPIMRRWGAFLQQRGTRLTVAQARSLRQRSTRAELLSLDVQQRALIGLHL